MQEIPQENHRLQLQQELHQVPQVNVNPILAEPSPQLISAPKRSTTRATTTEITTALGATAALENLNTQVIIKPEKSNCAVPTSAQGGASWLVATKC